jgi:thioredoxin reductase
VERFDVLVVGGGPAGLGAALILGRCRRSVLVCDAGSPRNAPARAIHGLLGLDGVPPAELLRKARGEARKYGAELRDVEVLDVRREGKGFEALLADGKRVSARKVILATGMKDEIPPIVGIRTYYGRGVYHCPYCDGFEFSDAPIGVLGPGEGCVRFALQLLRWTPDLVLFTNGPAGLSDVSRALLDKHRVLVREERVERLVGEGGELSAVVLEGAEVVPRRALFLKTGEKPRSDLPERLGCRVREDGVTDAEFHGSTEQEDIYVVGDASPRVQLVVVAAAEGAAAAVRLNRAMQEEDLGLV